MPSREANGAVPKMTGGQAIVGTLTQHGVDTVFGLPGVQLDNTFDALIEMPIGAVPNTWALVKRLPSAATN